MVTQPDLLVRWLGDTAELDPVAGGVFRFTLGDQDACVGRYVAALHEHGWDRFLGRLTAVTNGIPPGADPWEDHPDQVRTRLRQER